MCPLLFLIGFSRLLLDVSRGLIRLKFNGIQRVFWRFRNLNRGWYNAPQLAVLKAWGGVNRGTFVTYLC